ncbi:hypothetical protein Tco_0438935 [Tanacetum coccineum]
MISLQPRTDEPATSYLPNQQPCTCTVSYQSYHVAASDWPQPALTLAQHFIRPSYVFRFKHPVNGTSQPPSQWQVNDGSIDRSRFNGVGHDGLPADQSVNGGQRSTTIEPPLYHWLTTTGPPPDHHRTAS